MRPSTFLSLFFFGHMLFLDMPFSEFYQFLVGLFREAEPCQVSKNGGVNVTRYHCCYSRNHQGRQGTCISKYPHHYQILLILSFYPYKRTRVKLYIRLNFWSFLWNIDVFFIFIVLNFELLFSVFMHSRIVQNRISLVRGVWGGGGRSVHIFNWIRSIIGSVSLREQCGSVFSENIQKHWRCFN